TGGVARGPELVGLQGREAPLLVLLRVRRPGDVHHVVHRGGDDGRVLVQVPRAGPGSGPAAEVLGATAQVAAAVADEAGDPLGRRVRDAVGRLSRGHSGR